MEDGDTTKRDEVQNKAKFKQRILFEGLIRRDRITPTDIDGFIDYKGNAFVFLEAKTGEADMKYGQKLAYINLIQRLQKAGALAICILFKHNTPSHEHIKASKQEVDSIYMFDEDDEFWTWKVPTKTITVSQALDTFEKKCVRKGIKIFKNM